VEPFGIERQAVAGRPHVWCVSVSGELDLSTVPRLEEMIDLAMAQGARSILLDLGKVTFLDSTGLRSILHLADRLEAGDGGLTCVGLSAAAERVLELKGVLEKLKADPAEAHLSRPDRVD
jgi:anti-sigma B factor antagonist